MPIRIIAIASDHGGFALKTVLSGDLTAAGHQVLDFGTDSAESVDYPDYAAKVAEALRGPAQLGVLLCGAGIGMSIAANRFPWVRAALVHDGLTAKLSRQHNDANILVLGGRTTGIETAKDCLRIFLETDFEGGRHARRLAKLAASPDLVPADTAL